LTLVEREAGELPLKTQAELLSLHRSGLYYQPVPPSAAEVAMKHRIDEIYTRYPFYGSPPSLMETVWTSVGFL